MKQVKCERIRAKKWIQDGALSYEKNQKEEDDKYTHKTKVSTRDVMTVQEPHIHR